MRWPLFILSAGVAALTASTVFNPAPVIVWNNTESVPRGLYLHASRDTSVGAIVAIEPDYTMRTFLTERHYLPQNVPLMKQVAALSGDEVCRQGDRIFINHSPVAVAKKTDSSGRRLPEWQGCFILSEQEIFLLGTHEHSLDGRYFGSVSTEYIIGTYRLLWEANG